MKRAKKITILVTLLLAIVISVITILLIPHTITIMPKLYSASDTKEAKNNFDSEPIIVKTNLYESMKQPKELSSYIDKESDKAFVLTGFATRDNGIKLANNNAYDVWKSVTVDANYKPKEYSINLKDGSSTSVINYSLGEKLTLPTAAIEQDKHPYENFKGWIDDKGNTISEVSSEEIDGLTDITLNAAYEGKEYKIQYDLDGGAASNPTTYIYGTGLEKLADASKSGYTFDGWFNNAEKTNKVDSISKETHDDLTLYAKFTKIPEKKIVSNTYRNYGNKNWGYSRKQYVTSYAPTQQAQSSSNSSNQAQQAPAQSTQVTPVAPVQQEQVQAPAPEPAPSVKYTWNSVAGDQSTIDAGYLTAWRSNYFAAHNWTSYGRALLNNVQAGDLISLNGRIIQLDGSYTTTQDDTYENVEAALGYPDACFQTCIVTRYTCRYLIWYGHYVS